MKSLYLFGLLLLAALLVLAGCKGSEPKGPATYPIKGKVMAVDPAKPSVKLDHEDIPGHMKAMQMTFEVENPKLLEGLKPGDRVQGQLRVESGKSTLTQLEKLPESGSSKD